MSFRPTPGARSAVLALLLLLAGGCATARPEARPPAPRAMPILDGATGARIGFEELLERVGGAEVVILGETHDDGPGHAAQLEIYRAAVERHPGTALSMEMLERDEQRQVDDYLDGRVDAAALVRSTGSANWGGRGRWGDWYQPIVDAARDAGAPVIAANAPRRYVRAARAGYDRPDEMTRLTPWQRSLFERPPSLPEGRYRERFDDVMTGDEPVDPAVLEELFRAQLVWDATMAGSIVAALDGGAPKVVHLVGQFHSDFEGGTVLELRRRRPGTRLLVVSLRPVASATLRDEDRGRADVVVYTRGE